MLHGFSLLGHSTSLQVFKHYFVSLLRTNCWLATGFHSYPYQYWGTPRDFQGHHASQLPWVWPPWPHSCLECAQHGLTFTFSVPKWASKLPCVWLQRSHSYLECGHHGLIVTWSEPSMASMFIWMYPPWPHSYLECFSLCFFCLLLLG